MRVKQITRSPGLRVWTMMMPNGFLSYEIMKGKHNSENYVDLIKFKALLIIKLNAKNDFLFQQDNCLIHIFRESLKFFNESSMTLLHWPSYNPDLNIVENIWYMLSNDIYSQGSMKNLKELCSPIYDSVSV